MSAQWHGRKWKLQVTTDLIEPLLVSGGSNANVFRLQPVKSKGQIVCYRVTYRRGKMADCWKDCILFPRGRQPASEPQPPLGATPSEEELLDAAMTATDAIKQHSPLSTERLEGELSLPPAQLPGAVTLYQVPEGLGGQEAFLMLVFDQDRASPGGVGGGGSVRT